MPSTQEGTDNLLMNSVNILILQFQSLLPSWIHDGAVSESLEINKKVEQFKKDLQGNPRFLQEKVEQYFGKVKLVNKLN